MADQYGRFAALKPASTGEIQLYACPAGRFFQGRVSVCNQAGEAVEYSIARCAAGHGDNPALSADWRCFNVPVDPGPPHEITVNMGAGETIRVKTDQADSVSFILEGLLI